MLRSLASRVPSRSAMSLVIFNCRAFRTLRYHHHHLQHHAGGVVALGNLGKISASRAVHTSVMPNRTRSSSQTSPEDIDKSLLRLDGEIRRTGRVAREEIIEILQDIREMKKATSSQSLMIIRCCGELVPGEAPENRTKLVQEVWKTMESLNVPMDISHYNALLRVYLENEHKFNPTEFLQELNSKGIEPNRVTYQRLISRFCQDGDIEGASTILQFMKEKQLPINEHVFNALINGHARADDMESAEGIVAVMKQAGLEPNDDTYVTLMCGYARKGDIDNIKRIVKECGENDVFLMDRDFLEVVFTLASQGHESLIDQVVPLLKKSMGFNHDNANLILRLVSIGKEEVGYRMLKEMNQVIKREEVIPSGNFFINKLVKSQMPVERVVKYCHKLMEEGLNSHALLKACEIALESKDFEKGFDLLDAAKASGFPLRQHYFWPFFAGSKSEKDIYYGLKTMKYLGVTPTTESLREYIIPNLFRVISKKNPESDLEKLSNYTGIQLSTIVPAAIQHLLSENDVETVARFAGIYRLRFTNPQMRRAIIDSYIKTKDAKSFVLIAGNAVHEGQDSVREVVGSLLLELLEASKPQDKAKNILPVLNELLSKGLGLSNSGSELIQNNLGDVLTSELASAIAQLTSPDLVPESSFYAKKPAAQRSSPLSTHAYEDLSAEELEGFLENAIREGKPIRAIQRGLLFNYCRSKNLDKANAIKESLQSQGFVFGTGLHALLLELYCHHNKLEDAVSTYAALVNTSDQTIDETKILKYATLLANNDRVQDCINVLQNATKNESRKTPGALQQALVWKLLNGLAESGQVENIRQILQILKDRNLANINNVVLGPLIKAHLAKDDLEAASAEFERCVKEHHCTPWKQELFCRFIKAEDTERLQKVMDLSTNLHGEVNSMYDLVFAFIQCGKVRQAKRILETPGLRARNDKIEYTCQKYLEENRTSELEDLIQVTKDVIDIDRNSMYFYLLKLYCKEKDADKALSVWTSLQEENIQASPDLLIFLADFLQKHNRPVPFVIPEQKVPSDQPDSVANSKQSSPSASSAVTNFRKLIESNEIDKALQIKQRLDGNIDQGKLTLTDLTNLVEKMARAERLGESIKLTEEMLEKGIHPYPRTLRFLLGRLAAAAEVDVLKRIETKLSPDLKRQSMYNTRLCVAYTNAERGKEYFENYIKPHFDTPKSEGEERYFPLSGATYILIRNEELLKEYEALAVKAEAQGDPSIYNSIWSYHLLSKNFETAKDIWQNKLKNQTRVLFRSVLIEARVRREEDVANELANQIASSEVLSPATKGAAYSCVIDILVSKEKIDDALSYFEEKQNTVPIQDFSGSTLRRLKEKAISSNRSFAYEIPKKEQRRRAAGSDSDSD